jgi:hypothetical protein
MVHYTDRGPAVKVFTIATVHVKPRRWFRVVVHRDVETLREAAYQMKRRWGYERATFAGMLATVQSVDPMFRVEAGDPRDSEWTSLDIQFPSNGYAGTIRLNEDNLTMMVVAHELVHATASVFRMNCSSNFSVDLGTGLEDLRAEEQFAYIYGELAKACFGELRLLYPDIDL